MPCPTLCLLPTCPALSIIILRAKANPQGNPHPSPPRAPIAHRPCVVTCTQNLLSRWATRTLACFLLPHALRGPMASLCLDRVGSIDGLNHVMHILSPARRALAVQANRPQSPRPGCCSRMLQATSRNNYTRYTRLQVAVARGK